MYMYRLYKFHIPHVRFTAVKIGISNGANFLSLVPQEVKYVLHLFRYWFVINTVAVRIKTPHIPPGAAQQP